MANKFTATNEELANLLRNMAEYVELSERPAKVRIALDVEVMGQRIRLPSDTLLANGLRFSLWAAEYLQNQVQDYQATTGNPEGEDIVKAMKGYVKALTDLGYGK